MQLAVQILLQIQEANIKPLNAFAEHSLCEYLCAMDMPEKSSANKLSLI